VDKSKNPIKEPEQTADKKAEEETPDREPEKRKSNHRLKTSRIRRKSANRMKVAKGTVMSKALKYVRES